jgi:hypothetical protein
LQYTILWGGRISEKTETINQNIFTFGYNYNSSSGMLETYTYPSGFKLKYVYNQRGDMSSIFGFFGTYWGGLWNGTQQNQRGQWTNYGGPSLFNTNLYDDYGYPTRTVVLNLHTKAFAQDYRYGFEPATGNLSWRTDAVRGLTESFTYDGDLHTRLTGWSINGQNLAELQYQPNGNSLIQNENIGTALSNGINSALWGGTIGGLTGGVFGGIRAARAGNNFWSGNPLGGKYGGVPQVDMGSIISNNTSQLFTNGMLREINAVSIDGYVPATWDATTDLRISTLHPRVQSTAARFINRVDSELGIKLRITHGLRSFAEQDALYRQGRSIAGNIVTNLQGGYSYHNYGLAFDVAGIAKGAANYNLDWSSIGNIGVSMGLEWGGNFRSFLDRPHFQMTFGHSIQDLIKLNH